MKIFGIVTFALLAVSWLAWAVVLTVVLPFVGIPALIAMAVITPLGLAAGHSRRPVIRPAARKLPGPHYDSMNGVR